MQLRIGTKINLLVIYVMSFQICMTFCLLWDVLPNIRAVFHTTRVQGNSDSKIKEKVP